MRLKRGVAVVVVATLGAGSAQAQTQLPTAFVDLPVIAHLSTPAGMAFLPDGRLLVVEQKTARVRLIVNGALAATDPVISVPAVRTAGNEQGLLGIAVDPGWPARPYFYVYYDWLGSSTIRISRYRATGDLDGTSNGAIAADTAAHYEVLTGIPDVQPNHNGGTLRFGLDGMLYASLGDDAQGCPAQDTTTFHGVILRMDVSRLPLGPGGPAPLDSLVAAGNPFDARPNANERLVWALGLRNPFRYAVDASDGTLFIGDVGENSVEEEDHATQGGLDFGWPVMEGNLPSITCPGVTGPFTPPIATYPHCCQNSFAIIGGPVYHAPSGANGPFGASYEGDVFYNDYYNGFLRRLKKNGAAWSIAPVDPGQPDSTDWGTGYDGISDWLIAGDGSLWYCRQATAFQANTGEIRRIATRASLAVVPAGPAAVQFEPPAPNPATHEVTLAYTLPAPARVSLLVIDLAGRRVATLRAPGDAGRHAVTWSAASVTPGVYFARLEVDGHAWQRRMAVVR